MPQFYDAIPVDWIAEGKTATIEVEGFPVGVANVGGQFYAFQSLCPHQGSRLAGQPLENEAFVTCPSHASRYDVRTGACVRPASSDGFEQDLLIFPCRVRDEVVQVSI